jgi:hypothetical protein
MGMILDQFYHSGTKRNCWNWNLDNTVNRQIFREPHKYIWKIQRRIGRQIAAINLCGVSLFCRKLPFYRSIRKLSIKVTPAPAITHTPLNLQRTAIARDTYQLTHTYLCWHKGNINTMKRWRGFVKTLEIYWRTIIVGVYGDTEEFSI